MLNIVNRCCDPMVFSIESKCRNQLDRVVQSIYNISVVIDKGTKIHEPFKTSHSINFQSFYTSFCDILQDPPSCRIQITLIKRNEF